MTTPRQQKISELLVQMRTAVDNNKPEVSDLLRDLATEVDDEISGKTDPASKPPASKPASSKA